MYNIYIVHLLLEVGLVVSVIDDELALLERQDGVGRLRQEEAVVRDHHDGALEVLQRLLEHLCMDEKYVYI